MGMDVHSLMLSIQQHFLCRPRCCPPSKVFWRTVYERMSWLMTCPTHSGFILLTGRVEHGVEVMRVPCSKLRTRQNLTERMHCGELGTSRTWRGSARTLAEDDQNAQTNSSCRMRCCSLNWGRFCSLNWGRCCSLNWGRSHESVLGLTRPASQPHGITSGQTKSRVGWLVWGF